MQWLLVQTPEGQMHAWALTVANSEPKLPPQTELESLIRKHVPEAVIESYSNVRAVVLLPADTDINKRSFIATDVRMRAHAHD